MRELQASWGRRLVGAGTVAAVAFALVATAASPASAAPPVAKGGTEAIADSYIVVFKNDTVSAQSVSGLVETLAAKAGAKVDYTYKTALRGFAGSMSADAAKALAADPSVASVTQNQTVKATTDQVAPPSWGENRVDQKNLPLDYRYRYATTAANVNAYVIDTGIKTTHVDFGGRATFDYNAVDTNNADCNGHGTHVAGTIGGTKYGLAKGVKLHAVKVLNCLGSGTIAGVTAGVDWVTANAVKPAVANMSLGAANDFPVLQDAVRASIASGVTYAIASGNFDSDACDFSPAKVTEAITVNASDIADARAEFSNWGTCTDIYAPGVDITSAWGLGDDNAEETISGTSMATPHVAGAVALYLATNPTATPAQVADAILAAATPDKITDPGTGSPNKLLNIADATAPLKNVLKRGESLQSGEIKKSANGQYKLVMQPDGNLVLYDGANKPVWHTATGGKPGKYLVLQDDGNLVLYSDTGAALWQTHTEGKAATLLAVQDDGNVVLFGKGGVYFWHRKQ
jgi:subtilisin family serine protease